MEIVHRAAFEPTCHPFPTVIASPSADGRGDLRMATTSAFDRDRFVAKLKKLEVSINVKKGTPIPPEDRVSGSGSPGPAGTTLERLRAEAAKTGDYSKVNDYKRQQRERSRK